MIYTPPHQRKRPRIMVELCVHAQAGANDVGGGYLSARILYLQANRPAKKFQLVSSSSVID